MGSFCSLTEDRKGAWGARPARSPQEETGPQRCPLGAVRCALWESRSWVVPYGGPRVKIKKKPWQSPLATSESTVPVSDEELQSMRIFKPLDRSSDWGELKDDLLEKLQETDILRGVLRIQLSSIQGHNHSFNYWEDQLWDIITTFIFKCHKLLFMMISTSVYKPNSVGRKKWIT